MFGAHYAWGFVPGVGDIKVNEKHKIPGSGISGRIEMKWNESNMGNCNGNISSTYSGINERKVGNETNIISFIEYKNLSIILTNIYILFSGCQELS